MKRCYISGMRHAEEMAWDLSRPDRFLIRVKREKQIKCEGLRGSVSVWDTEM